MKRILALTLALIMVLAMVACGNKTAEYYELPNLTHGTVWTAAFPYMVDFIRKHLR